MVLYRTLAHEVNELAATVNTEVVLQLDIRRSHVLSDAMREARKGKFSVTKMVQVGIK